MTAKHWEFDSYSSKHWEELKQGEATTTKSWVEVADGDYPGYLDTLRVFVDTKQKLEIVADRDQWGTWISVMDENGKFLFMAAQEDGTMSFIDALIAGLKVLQESTCYDVTPPKEF